MAGPLKYPRTIAISALWGLIVLSAHPIGPLRWIGGWAWDRVAPWGLDVSLTPLTVDMQLMGAGEQVSYHRVPGLEIRRGSSTPEIWERLVWEKAPFYGVRIPLLLLIGLLDEGDGRVSPEGHVRGICYQLRRSAPDVVAFKMTLLPARPEDLRKGIGHVWKCAPEGA